MDNKQQLQKFLVEEKKKEFDNTLTVLDALRRSRKSRGGVGSPLEVPKHLRASIIVTDADVASVIQTEPADTADKPKPAIIRPVAADDVNNW